MGAKKSEEESPEVGGNGAGGDAGTVPPSGSHDPARGNSRKRKRRGWLFLLLFGVVVVLLVRAVFDYASKNELLEKKLQAEKDLREAIYQLDDIEEELDSKISELKTLGGQVTTLLAAKEQLLREKEDIRNRNSVVIRELKERVEGYTQLLLEKDKEAERMKRTNEILLSQNVNLKNEANQLRLSIQDLNEKQQVLEERIHQAVRLRVGNVKMFSLRKNGKLSERMRASKLKRVRISFDVLKNKLALMGKRTIYLRLMAPDGEALFDVEAGGGPFSYKGKELFYTLKKDILYKRESVGLHFDYTQEKRFLPGQYTVEVYGEGGLIGQEVFRVGK